MIFDLFNYKVDVSKNFKRNCHKPLPGLLKWPSLNMKIFKFKLLYSQLTKHLHKKKIQSLHDQLQQVYLKKYIRLSFLILIINI